MSLKNNSFFNFTLYKKEIKILLWVTVLASFLLMFTLPYGYFIYSQTKDNINEELLVNPNTSYVYAGTPVKDLNQSDIIRISANYLTGQLKRFSFTQNIVLFILPIIAAALVMGQDRGNKSIDLVASMPLTRKQIFFSKVIAGLTMCLIPYVLTLVIASLLRAVFSELSIVFTFTALIRWFMNSIMPITLLFVSSIFVGTLVSPSFAVLSITPIFLAFPIGLGTLIYMNLIVFNFPFEVSIIDFLARALIFVSPAYFAIYSVTKITTPIVQLSPATHFIFAVLYTLAILAIGYYLYKKHKMEYSNELLIYPQLEKVFIIGVSICCALIAGPLMHLLFFQSVFAILPGYALGAFIGGWVARYLVKIKKTG